MSQLTFKKREIIYQLTIEDVQTVATEELGRELSATEVEIIKDIIAEKIPWFDAISDAIAEKLNNDDRQESGIK